MPVHVCQRAARGVQDCRHGGAEGVWVCNWEGRGVGWDIGGDYCGLSSSGMGSLLVAEVVVVLGWCQLKLVGGGSRSLLPSLVLEMSTDLEFGAVL